MLFYFNLETSDPVLLVNYAGTSGMGQIGAAI